MSKKRKLLKKVKDSLWQAIFELAWEGHPVFLEVNVNEENPDKIIETVTIEPMTQQQIKEACERGNVTVKIEKYV